MSGYFVETSSREKKGEVSQPIPKDLKEEEGEYDFNTLLKKTKEKGEENGA